jgi:hypothetical protein
MLYAIPSFSLITIQLPCPASFTSKNLLLLIYVLVRFEFKKNSQLILHKNETV